jgi:hypothetical protein
MAARQDTANLPGLTLGTDLAETSASTLRSTDIETRSQRAHMADKVGKLAVAVGFVLLGSCATSTHQSDPERRAQYAAYAGPPIQQFTWLGHFDGWEPLGKTDLIVFTTPSDAYLLKVWPPCDLRFAFNGHGGETIGVTSAGGTVSARVDSIIEHSAAVGRAVCPISEIRKVDYRRMLADERRQAQAKKQASG